MTWPKKNTRKVVVDGEIYQWQWDQSKALYRWIVIGKRSADGQLLFVDPYWLSATPGQICQAISFALASGWEPHCRRKPFRIESKLVDAKFWEFFVLPDEAAPGKMLWTLGAGMVLDEGTISEGVMSEGMNARAGGRGRQ